MNAYSKAKVLNDKSLQPTLNALRAQNKSIATLNGSFDLLHAGHLYMIVEAAKQADVLIVAINSDASIKAYKSEDRPLIPEQERMEMLAALGFVDYVILFDELDPRAILKKICPDVHVNGEEYGQDCIEAAVVKKLHLVKRIPGLSTSEIIDKVAKLNASPLHHTV